VQPPPNATQRPNNEACELRSAFARIEKKAQETYEWLRSSGETVKRYADDIARARLIIDSDPAIDLVSAEDKDALLVDVRYAEGALDSIKTNVVPKLQEQLVKLSVSAPTGVMSIVSANISGTPGVPDLAFAVFNAFRIQQQEADESQGVLQACKDHILRLKCDEAYGQSTAANSRLLEQAWGAFRTPVHDANDALGPLISIRECIDHTLESLKRRLLKSNVRGDAEEKGRAILADAGRDGIGYHESELLVSQLVRLRKELSSKGKDAGLARAETQSLLSAATNWLHRFLGSVDETKLR
jgi:hypothetical protein